ncbi:hypothetical protein [Brevundimonas sp. UBA7534]|uniref:hypothetical protein n=1 Tax=Brevundimonas sp. UBA7534 TaxID=1946138 RepID=UPI0025BC042B|nr:hypothetical protein [Brevundimonas sp. UBA7534]
MEISEKTATTHPKAIAIVSLVIVMCSKRKRAVADPLLIAGDLPVGDSKAVAADWGRRLRQAAPAVKAGDLYAGRGFSEATRAAAHLEARLAIVSAGLGLVDAGTIVPAYSLTTVPRDPDNILGKIGGSAREWWKDLQSVSPYQSDALARDTGPILAALSAGYLAMVADEWSRWPRERLARLRIFSKEKPSSAAAALLPAWMPYDDRLDFAGPNLEGTQGDFAQRALRHFATSLRSTASAQTDSDSVRVALDGLSPRPRPVRIRRTDDEVIELIHAHWDHVDGRSGLMLRHLRDTLGFACEQGRFKTLFHKAAASQRGRAA